MKEEKGKRKKDATVHQSSKEPASVSS